MRGLVALLATPFLLLAALGVALWVIAAYKRPAENARRRSRWWVAVGDKVKLRGGGRVMIVSLVVGYPPPWPWPSSGGVECQWFIQDDLQTAVFNSATLDRVE